jgi:hypothetical protein
MNILDILVTFGGIVLSSALGVFGWIIKGIKDEIKNGAEKTDDVETKLEAHRLYAAETFATKIDMHAGFNRILDKLEKIDEYLRGHGK